ncbi:DODA-type extradiol aromatic ring-opening family dioxygenase [Cohnella cholangitidis]|uniref:Dioxygenase n=1 Tax=Cohnella cholangitidis TaxID=2598458 RepID=A0A7G5C775_9BACL|nr:class III extradiol ring-cleavage dioxygenase [Cohnella cholangitidis]QMV45059.1 dioxygenase [Cohnella cholangitidis]
MMPSYFIAHGAPSLVLDKVDYTDFLKSYFAASHPRPKAIVLFSAHWESRTQTISAVPDTYSTIYDFGGFQDELYRMKYPAKGDRSVSEEIERLFKEHRVDSAIDVERGLDHGAWAILKLMYPDADIPVIALSVNRYLTNEQQYRIGAALAELREKDILVIGSGGTVHNLRRVNWRAEEAEEWAETFDGWLEDKLLAWDTQALFEYRSAAPHAVEAVPTNEHFIPLLLAMGAGDRNRQAKLLHRSYQYGTLSLSCWQFN